MKKFLVGILFLGILSVLLINQRTPFFQKDGGGWSVGYGESSDYPKVINVKENDIYSIEKLKAQNDSTVFLADPFFVKEKDTFYLFFEHKKTKTNGDVGLLTSIDGKNYYYRGTVLTQKFHLSYPQVFKYKNCFYMVPESKQANAVLLYKAYHFPYDWRVCDTLVSNVRLKDPSIYVSDSLSIMVASDDKLNMYVYQADSLFGKWSLNKKPIALMGTEARAGGRFFADKKGLILPIQNCTNGYGYGLSLYRFSFKDGSYTTKRESPFFLKANKDIKEFNAGMHQLDIQRLDANHYYYVYDGSRLNSDSKKINIWGPLKWTYIDLKNWILN
ncbi:glucosamine inositolphosphorylceramide transferase family protein [Flavobacterium taihuense]|uniref:Glucosamine inositolphosphorylceramide transferase 1 N-terminal domain-containing protein n=1 Tax=Flavobacterium taihuense TaxID=2857508 RepID=A0ABS6XUM4_9FLAO|nr:hypothetical protein [Flavobacterium taihuense]MBW4360388.1 hypothetical protein [Flavobacterium taihuense]